MSLRTHKKAWELLFVCGCFLIGILFRLWFITLAPQPFGWDQYEYEMYTLKMVNDPHLLASHSYRSYPYPLFLALAYKIIGFGNHRDIFFAHAVLDSLVGIMVYLILRNGLRNWKAAVIGIIAYMVNPFSSGYVGVLLSEILTIFFITATFLCGSMFIKRPHPVWALLLGVSAGFAAETRNAAFIWAAVPLGLCLIWVSWRRIRI